MLRRSLFRTSPRVPETVREAYETAIAFLVADGGIDGRCLEASVLMHKALREAGMRPKLVKRDVDEGPHPNGHWTVEVKGIEYDPTIGHAPWGEVHEEVPRDDIYVVERRSPHRHWKKLPSSDKVAYRAACEPYGLD